MDGLAESFEADSANSELGGRAVQVATDEYLWYRCWVATASVREGEYAWESNVLGLLLRGDVANIGCDNSVDGLVA